MDLRTREQFKIHCSKKHFEALANGIEMQVATHWSEIKAIAYRLPNNHWGKI